MSYLEQLNLKLSQRQQLRSIHSSSVRLCRYCIPSMFSVLATPIGSEVSSEGCDFSISDVFFSEYDSSLCYVIAGNQNHGHIGVILIENGKATMNLMDTEFDCRVCSFVLVREDMAFAGLISGYIIALHLQDVEGVCGHRRNTCLINSVREIDHDSLQIHILPDAPLRLHCADGRLFAALANGTLTVLEVKFFLYHYPGEGIEMC
ncbi:hypothetical protein COOONC_00007 [Cooperia oncophora]